MLENHSPDIITGCETWLTSSILCNEVIPRNYKLYRKDRKDGYGGVLIGIKFNLLSKLIDLNTSCEICAVVIELSQNQLVVINAYRPPNRDVIYQQELCNCICEIVRNILTHLCFVLEISTIQILTGLVTRLLITNIPWILISLS